MHQEIIIKELTNSKVSLKKMSWKMKTRGSGCRRRRKLLAHDRVDTSEMGTLSDSTKTLWMIWRLFLATVKTMIGLWH
jgi:hypothetical protein